MQDAEAARRVWSQSFRRIIDLQNLVFFLELCFEVLLNVVGYGPGGFFDHPWKGFDLLVALGSLVGYLAGSNGHFGNFARSEPECTR